MATGSSHSEIDSEALARAAMVRLRRRLALTRASIALERLAEAFWPLLAWTLVILAALRLGLPALAPDPWGAAGLALAGVVWLVLLALGARAFRMPTAREARDRLDASLPGRPLQTLEDRQAIGREDAGARLLWARHLERMAALAERSRAAVPRIRLEGKDPYALRLVALYAFAAAMLFGQSDPVASLRGAVAPPAPVLATGPSWEGWAEPPGYTGKPSVYLNDIAEAGLLTVPQGTVVTLRVYGATATARLEETVTETGTASFDADGTATEGAEGGGLAEVAFAVTRSGEIRLAPPSGAPVSLRVAMTPDTPPEISLSGEITRTIQGEFQMPFHARDDYRVTGGEARIELDLASVDRRHGLAPDPEPREPIVLDLPMPFSRDTADFEETLVEDLSEHPWAGLPVIITLSVADDLGQTGHHATEPTPMPGKRFFDTTAGAIAEMRRDLLWSRENARRTIRLLKAITWEPEKNWGERPEKAYLMVRTAIRRLEYNLPDLSATVRDEVAELLWKAAILIEDGDLGDARARLKRAQERLSEAMKNGATPEEIQELMDELRRATNDYIRQLAEEQRRNGEQNQQAENQNGQTITQDQLQQMMDRIQELMEQGRMDEAQELMRQLQEMMENMRVTESQQGQGQGNEAMEGLSDTLREQQDLADETFRQLQEEFRRERQRRQQQGQQGQQGEQQGQQQPGQQPGQQQMPGQGGEQQFGQNRPGQQGQPQSRPGDQQGQGQGEQQTRPGQRGGENGLSQRELAERQRALREMLRAQRETLERGGVPGGEAVEDQLDEAERQMGQAEEALREGDEGTALDRQADAMEALREGLRQLNEAQRQAQSQQQGGQQGQQAGPPGQQRRDPLGRPLSENGEIGTNERLVPEEELYRRSREILDEIRRRSGDRNRPRIELDYLRRLLDRF